MTIIEDKGLIQKDTEYTTVVSHLIIESWNPVTMWFTLMKGFSINGCNYGNKPQFQDGAKLLFVQS